MFDDSAAPVSFRYKPFTRKLSAKSAKRNIVFSTAGKDITAVVPHFYTPAFGCLTAMTLTAYQMFTARAILSAGRDILKISNFHTRSYLYIGP